MLVAQNEILMLIPQTHVKTWCAGVHIWDPRTKKVEANRWIRPTQSACRAPGQWKTLPQNKNNVHSIRRTLKVDLWPPHAYTHVHLDMCTCIHTHTRIVIKNKKRFSYIIISDFLSVKVQWVDNVFLPSVSLSLLSLFPRWLFLTL